MNVAATAASVALVIAIVTGTAGALNYFATKDDVAANSVAILYVKLENAILRNDKAEIRRLCWAIQQQTKTKPAGCP